MYVYGAMLFLYSACTSANEVTKAPVETSTVDTTTAVSTDSGVVDSGEEPEEITWWQPESVTTVEEEVLATAVTAASLSHFRLFAQQSDGFWYSDPTLPQDYLLPAYELRQAVVTSDGVALFFMEDGLFVWDQDMLDLEPSPFGQVWQDTLVASQSDSLGLWLMGEQGLFRWRDGQLESVSMTTSISGFAAGAQWHDEPAVWVLADGVHALVDTAQGLQVAASVDIKGQQLAVDRLDRVWVVDDEGLLFMRDTTGWSQLAIESPVQLVHSNANSASSWLQVGEEVWLWQDEQLWSVNPPRGQWLGVDGSGRLLTLEQGELLRYSSGRAPGLLGLPRQQISHSFELVVSPSFAAEVSAVKVSLNGQESSLTERPWKLLVEPVNYGQGLLNIDVTIEYLDGSVVTTQQQRTIDLGISTWDDKIAPLNAAKCLACHGGTTFTLLDTKNQWIEYIDTIIAKVESGEMPQGQAPLSADEVGNIILWRDGGFP